MCLTTGETVPLKLKYQLHNVRERLAKNLCKKGVFTTVKKDALHCDMTMHPLADLAVKIKLVKRIQDSMLSRWVNDPHRMDKRMLSLLYLAHASDVLKNAFAHLSREDYEVAMKRVRQLLHLEFEQEGLKDGANETMWAVIKALTMSNTIQDIKSSLRFALLY